MRITSGDIPPTAAATLVRALQNSRFFPKEISVAFIFPICASRWRHIDPAAKIMGGKFIGRNEQDRPSAIDAPLPGERVYDQCIFVAGKFTWPEGSSSPRLVRAWIDDVCIGETRVLTETDSPEWRPQYKILGKLPEPITTPREAVIATRLYLDGDETGRKLGEVTVQLVPARLRERHYGEVVPPDQATVLHRENIYGSGPPIEQASPQVLQLVLEYLSPASSMVDVGCGAGAFGPGLMNAGHKWMGLEVNNRCFELLERRQLPYRKLTDATPRFPCADHEFDHAICIEVLEHIKDPGPFLSEIARTIRGRALFSVPNMEVLPYLKD